MQMREEVLVQTGPGASPGIRLTGPGRKGSSGLYKQILKTVCIYKEFVMTTEVSSNYE